MFFGILPSCNGVSSQAFAVPMVRRHARTAEDEHHYGPVLGVVSGNYVTGRRRGTVDGIDFGATGSGTHMMYYYYRVMSLPT